MGAGKHYTTLPDEQLMHLIAEKDTRAFEALYDRYSRLLYNYFHRMLWKDREKARDFTQDLFAKIARKPASFDPKRSFKTWIYSVAHNMCKNEYAKHEVRRAAHSEMKYDSFSALPEEGSRLDRALFRDRLQEELAAMDEVKRTTFELRFNQELSILEISEIMQCSEGTVKSRLFYLLKELNQKLRIFEGMLGFAWIIRLFEWL